jgi:hypothetical protein
VRLIIIIWKLLSSGTQSGLIELKNAKSQANIEVLTVNKKHNVTKTTHRRLEPKYWNFAGGNG